MQEIILTNIMHNRALILTQLDLELFGFFCVDLFLFAFCFVTGRCCWAVVGLFRFGLYVSLDSGLFWS
jgi:hypothetical protein